jgi:hypothetical protein
MISPQLGPDSATPCPPGASGQPFNVTLEHTLPLDEPPLVLAIGADMGSRTTTDAVVDGLWHCLLGSLATGLGVSMLLGVLVLALNQIS